MAFIPDPNNIHRVYDPDTGFALENIVHDVPFSQRYFILRIKDKSIHFHADFEISDEKETSYYTFKNDRLMNSYRSALQITGLNSIDDFMVQILPIIRDAISVYDRSKIPSRWQATWTTKVTFEI